MNANDRYLFQILQKYSARNLSVYSYELITLSQKLKLWANGCYIDLVESGSRAKGTAISLASDVDYLVSLTSNCNENTGGLESIYNSLYSTLKAFYPSARKQNVSIRIDLPGLLGGNLEVDITPARKWDTYTADHSLWVFKNDTWKKTNIQKHIFDISNSGRQNEIKLLKIWRELNRLEFPSIYLEYLLVNNVLLSKPFGNLAANFLHILIELSKDTGNPLFFRVVDPANSNNVLSDLLTLREKNLIVSVAKSSIQQSGWNSVVW